MTANLAAHRLLKAYQAAAADGYPGGPRDFSELADLAEACLANVALDERLPAAIIVNAFHLLAESKAPTTEPLVPPAFHEALVATLTFLVDGGEVSHCHRLSQQLVRNYPAARPEGV
jgi:hypothetical protein